MAKGANEVTEKRDVRKEIVDSFVATGPSAPLYSDALKVFERLNADILLGTKESNRQKTGVAIADIFILAKDNEIMNRRADMARKVNEHQIKLAHGADKTTLAGIDEDMQTQWNGFGHLITEKMLSNASIQGLLTQYPDHVFTPGLGLAREHQPDFQKLATFVMKTLINDYIVDKDKTTTDLLKDAALRPTPVLLPKPVVEDHGEAAPGYKKAINYYASLPLRTGDLMLTAKMISLLTAVEKLSNDKEIKAKLPAVAEAQNLAQYSAHTPDLSADVQWQIQRDQINVNDDFNKLLKDKMAESAKGAGAIGQIDDVALKVCHDVLVNAYIIDPKKSPLEIIKEVTGVSIQVGPTSPAPSGQLPSPRTPPKPAPEKPVGPQPKPKSTTL